MPSTHADSVSDNPAISSASFAPPLTPAAMLHAELGQQGYAVLGAADVMRLTACSAAELGALSEFWNDLPPDEYLKDGGRYRRRRHSCFVIDGTQIRQTAHRAHWQPVQYNALHGGMERHFAAVDPAMVAQPGWARLLLWLARVADALKGPQPWYLETHPFRIDTTNGIGRPTPEGAHRDGVDLVAVFLVARQGVRGGETRVFDARGPQGQRFTLSEPWSLLLLDDARVIHETTPIQPCGSPSHRDTLVVTLRAGSFQGENEPQ